MRQIAAIFLFLAFLFYHVGYYALYLTSWYQLEASWKEKVENDDLDEKFLQMESINLSIPYQQDQESFQPSSGTVEIAGRIYRVVKQRYAQDTLHVVFFNDIKGAKLKESFKKWLSSINQKPITENGAKVLLINFIKNYLPNFFKFEFLETKSLTRSLTLFSENFVSRAQSIPFLPPEA